MTAAADAQGFERAIDPSRETQVFLNFDSPLRDCLWVARLPLAPTAHLVGKVFASVVSKRQLQSDMEERCKNTLPGDFEIAEQQKRCEHFPNNIRANCYCFCLILGARNTVEATAVLVDAHCNVCRHCGAKPALLNSMQQKMPQCWRPDSFA